MTQSVGEVRAGTPAAKVLRPGDRIVAVDGNTYPGLDTEERLERFREDVAATNAPANRSKAARPRRRWSCG